MARIKSARIEIRIAPEKKDLWKRFADAEGMSVTEWLERNAGLVMQWRQTQAQLETIYPNRPDLCRAPWEAT